jgi:uroporphyrinogen-III synthase/uroporphyrinogen III methyltransferase/synthase
MSELPLAGRRILVTRAAHQAGKLSEGLRAKGAEPVEVPVLEIGPPNSFEALDHALRRLENYDWLILTSANAVRAMVERAAALGLVFSESNSLKVAAVGVATAAEARNAGFSVAVVPENYVAESLVESLSGQVTGKRIVLARAAVARDVIPDALRAAGAALDVVDAYQNCMPANAPAQLKHALASCIDAVAFTSSSSVTNLSDAAHAAGLSFPFADVAAVSIGPITSKTLRDAGWEPAIEASPSDVPGLIEAVVRLFGLSNVRAQGSADSPKERVSR